MLKIFFNPLMGLSWKVFFTFLYRCRLIQCIRYVVKKGIELAAKKNVRKIGQIILTFTFALKN